MRAKDLFCSTISSPERNIEYSLRRTGCDAGLDAQEEGEEGADATSEHVAQPGKGGAKQVGRPSLFLTTIRDLNWQSDGIRGAPNAIAIDVRGSTTAF